MNGQSKWYVLTEPVGKNPGLKSTLLNKVSRSRKTGPKAEKGHDNIGGIVVYLARGSRKEEFARVGWIRSTSENPKVSFQEKMNEVMKDAETSIEVLNRCQPDGELV